MMAGLLQRLWPWLSNGALSVSGQIRQPVRQILVVRDGPSASYDYYLAPRLLAPHETRPVRVVDLKADPAVIFDHAAADGTFVLFCRYLSAPWLSALERHTEALAGIGLFVDDDIAGLVNDGSVPWPYRIRLVRKHLWHLPGLSLRLNLVLVSTPALADRLADCRPRLVPPVGSAADTPGPGVAAHPSPVVAFHSTASHTAEHAWLAPILRDVAAAVPACRFDIYANWRTRRYWRGLPNVTLHDPAAWPIYRSSTRERGASLLLAPMLDGPVNAARAPTKRIDAWRMGAGLISNAVGVYRPSALEQTLGGVVPLVPEAWRDTVCAVLANPRRLQDLATENARLVRTWGESIDRLPIP
jgi:hypothetical protein